MQTIDFFNNLKTIIYVGHTDNLWRRIKEHLDRIDIMREARRTYGQSLEFCFKEVENYDEPTVEATVEGWEFIIEQCFGPTINLIAPRKRTISTILKDSVPAE